MSNNTVRDHRVDALRGIAALSVAVGHCVTTFSIVKQYNKTFRDLNYDSYTEMFLRLLHIIFNADAAVIIFFVLSGYVLTKSLSRINSGLISEFFIYVVKRVYRILPTVAISFIPLAYFIDGSAWEFFKNMFLFKVSINGVTWTLQVEMVASLLIFLVFVISKKAKYLAVPLFVVLVVLFLIGYYPLLFKYFPAFFLGCYVGEIRKILSGRKFILPIAIFFLLTADFFFGYGGKITVILVTICSVIIISCTSSSNIFKFLDYKIFQYLGKVSFSFYLYHYTGTLLTLKICAKYGIPIGGMNQIANIITLMAMSIPIAIILASLSYRIIESPSSSAGTDVTGLIKSALQKFSKKHVSDPAAKSINT